MISGDILACFHLLNHLLSHSLVGRLHEAFRQCQDLKTEKAQMDRKINQLSEENGDLSFKVWGAVSSLCPHNPDGCDGTQGGRFDGSARCWGVYGSDNMIFDPVPKPALDSGCWPK